MKTVEEYIKIREAVIAHTKAICEMLNDDTYRVTVVARALSTSDKSFIETSEHTDADILLAAHALRCLTNSKNTVRFQ